MKKLKLVLIQFLGTAVLFSLLISIGTCLVLLVSSSLGYLPYSDRPGPGWYGAAHWPTWGEAKTYFGFIPFFAYFVFFQGCAIFLMSLVLNLSTPPKWLLRLIGGVTSLFGAGLAVLGAGWYIALASIGSYAALAIGLLYGIFLFPKFLHPRKSALTGYWRHPLTVAATLAVVGWFLYPLLPKKPIPGINYQIDRLVSGNEPMKAGLPSWLGPDIPIEVAKLDLHGMIHSGIGGPTTGTSSASIDVLLIALEPIRKEAYLDLPARGYVVYTLQNGSWIPHPAFTEKDKRKLHVLSGLDPKFEGGRVQIDKTFAPTPFTWYPVVAQDSYLERN